MQTANAKSKEQDPDGARVQEQVQEIASKELQRLTKRAALLQSSKHSFRMQVGATEVGATILLSEVTDSSILSQLESLGQSINDDEADGATSGQTLPQLLAAATEVAMGGDSEQAVGMFQVTVGAVVRTRMLRDCVAQLIFSPSRSVCTICAGHRVPHAGLQGSLREFGTPHECAGRPHARG